MATHRITLAGEIDWPGFRREARALLAALVPPQDVEWHAPAGAAHDLFGAAEAARSPADSPEPAASPTAHGHADSHLVVPPAFIRLCETVILHIDPGRFALLYRLLWRLVHEPGLRHDPLDADRVQAQHMAQSVRRDLHKMKAFVRFRPIERGEGQLPLHVAWFEPDHHIVEAVAPFFVRRFMHMHWAILTPERSVRWTPATERLEFGPGVAGAPAHVPHPDDAFLLAGYRGIFSGRGTA